MKCIVVGKIKEKALESLVLEYEKRISYFNKIQTIVVKDESNTKDEIRVKQLEGERILSHIKEKDYVILLDLHGEMFSSEQISKLIQQKMIHHELVFVIAGSLGYSDDVIARANCRWCLSSATFPHQMVRLLLMEQVYRAFTIINHLPYHK